MTSIDQLMIVLTENGDESPYLYALNSNASDNFYAENKPMKNAQLSDVALRIRCLLTAVNQ
jgi:hypothetical protein